MTSWSQTLLILVGLSSPLFAQHKQVSAVGVDPTNPDHVWVCNRDNDSVSLIDVSTQSVVAEIPVGVRPRSLSISADGTTVLVTNQRGTVSLDTNFVHNQFNAGQSRGSVSVIDTGTLSVTQTIDGVGVEPYGVSYAPNGAYFVVSGFRSATMRFYDASTFALVAEHAYPRSLNFISGGMTRADVDEDRDGQPDLWDPRGFTIKSDSETIYVTHFKSPYVSVLDVTLDMSGVPTAVGLAAKINVDTYAPHPLNNPIPVQVLKSQGDPRFLEDIALSPDGSRALVPHVLHNVNHDVNFDFTTLDPGFTGDASNRVYPALTMIDTVANSYNPGVDNSNRLHHELSDTPVPGDSVAYGETQTRLNGARLTLGAVAEPIAGKFMRIKVDGLVPGDSVSFFWGSVEIDMVVPGTQGNLLCAPRRIFSVPTGEFVIHLPNNPSVQNIVACIQVLVQNPMTGENMFSNALRLAYGAEGAGLNKMGYRAGQPSRVVYNSTGTHALMLNRGSEDLFLYEVTGSDMELKEVFPPRHGHVERTALDTTTAMGDLPLGIAVFEDPSTPNDDALVYVINEATTSLSTLRVNYAVGTITKELDQISTIIGPDAFTVSQRIGQELFEDASRAQTAGNFNNSCASCHFEGGADGNVWQRPAGPRSTMPVFGGTRGTGLILWKGVRLSMGETGPMFGGENGGHGVFTNAEQDGLTNYHETIPFPLNPNLDEFTGDYDPLAAIGKDLFFGTNDSGTNPTMRHAGCAACHPDSDPGPTNAGERFYTADFLDPQLTAPGEAFQSLDPGCFSLRENIIAINIRDVNTGVNVDTDAMGGADLDRNGDMFSDLESYTPMNVDANDDFQRDDPNGYDCPCNPMVEPNCGMNGKRIFTRFMQSFSIPSKMGVFGTGPYFHDHSTLSLRALVDPVTQTSDPVYGDPTLPEVFKVFNGEHDVRGHEIFVPNSSKVQTTLQSTALGLDDDVEAILAYIQSL